MDKDQIQDIGGLGPLGSAMEKESEYITKKDDLEIMNRIFTEQGHDGLNAYISRNPELKDKYVNIITNQDGEVIAIPNKFYNMEENVMEIGDSGIVILNDKFGESKAKGGRVGLQTGGITETRTLPPEYIEALGKTYAADLTRQAGIPSITTAQAQQPGETAEQFAQRQSQAQQFDITKAGMADLAPQVAAQDPLQTAAYTQATDPTTGLGAYQPFLTKAGTAADAAGALTGPMTTAQTTAYMSPYQQQVIDASLADYDAQAAKSRLGLGSAAALGGAFGSGRQGVAEAEFDALSNRGRSGIQANLLQQGFQQAQQARQQDLANQMGLANLQSGLGGQAQGFAQSQIAGLGTLGSAQQAQSQAVLDAQRQFAQMAVDDPRRRLQMLGQGVAGLTPGAGQITFEEAPAAAASSPLATALGVGLAGADIYGRIFGPRKSTS